MSESFAEENIFSCYKNNLLNKPAGFEITLTVANVETAYEKALQGGEVAKIMGTDRILRA